MKTALARFNCQTLSQLQDRVVHEPDVFASLLDYLTVQVSEMFRDPSYFRALREQVVPLLRTYPAIGSVLEIAASIACYSPLCGALVAGEIGGITSGNVGTAFNAFATAYAASDFPDPCTPNISTPRGGSTPNFAASSLSASFRCSNRFSSSASTRSSDSSWSSSSSASSKASKPTHPTEVSSPTSAEPCPPKTSTSAASTRRSSSTAYPAAPS